MWHYTVPVTRTNESETAVYSCAFLTLGLVAIMSLPHYVFYAVASALQFHVSQNRFMAV